MSDLIRQALGWTTGPWPPDYYALLGLPLGPTDPDQVEAAVLERMEKLRVFQLVHPESVTEAMNLLARALITLSDPVAKSIYDAELPKLPLQPEQEVSQPRTETPTATEVAETSSPVSPKRIVTEQPALTPPLPVYPPSFAADRTEPPVPRQPTPLERALAGEWRGPTSPPMARSVRQRQRSAQSSIIRWVVQLRQLLNAWDEAGNWLSIPDLTFATRIEAVEVILAFRLIARNGPSIIDVNGPGAAVLNLAQSRPTSSALMDVTTPHREQLARDWRKGRTIILDEYERTRGRMRRQSRRFRIRQPWPTTMATWALMAFAIATVLIAVVRSWRGV